ncbi:MULTISPECIES: hypothetical protein [Streptomyces]|uniref:hypothetical protein n=1 Tax=Streptomyces TaxID=1883 RepID=UPI003B8A859C
MDGTPHGAAVTAGPSGSGRTCLLPALTGRMKPAAGTVEDGGHDEEGAADALAEAGRA